VPLNVRFDALFERREDGTTRLREHEFREFGITGFIGKHVAIDDDLRRRLVVADHDHQGILIDEPAGVGG